MRYSTEISEADIDYMNYIDNDEEEWRLIRDVRQQGIEENCFRLVIKDCKTGKKILNLITDQLTIDPEFSMETGLDTLVIKVTLDEEYIEENGDIDYLEDLEEFSKKYEEE